MTTLCDKTENYSGPLQTLHFHKDITACPSSTVRLQVHRVFQQYLSVKFNKLIGKLTLNNQVKVCHVFLKNNIIITSSVINENIFYA